MQDIPSSSTCILEKDHDVLRYIMISPEFVLFGSKAMLTRLKSLNIIR